MGDDASTGTDWQTIPFTDLASARDRYTQWLHQLRRHDLLPREFLLPQIKAACTGELPELMAHGATIDVGDIDALKAGIDALQPWEYGIQLRPGITTSNAEDPLVAVSRLVFRSHLITDTVRDLLGDSIRDTTFVDLACNHGYFSLEAAYHGARSVVGVDLRSDNIARANFLRNYFELPNASFRVQDVYDLDPTERFDVVYNLGLFYHVTDPYLLMQHTYNICNRFAVIDSIMHKEPVAAFLQMVNKDTSRPVEGNYAMELHPTYRAMIDLMRTVGFREIREIVPIEDEHKIEHPRYDRLERRCLIGFK